MSNAAIIEGLGEQDEIGEGGRARIVLPKSYFPVEIAVVEVGSTPVSEDRVFEDLTTTNAEGEIVPMPRGGTPYVTLAATIADGPFSELDPPAYFQSRFFLTPGGGRFIGVIQKACKALTGKPFDTAVLDKAGFEFPAGASGEDIQGAFRAQFYQLDVETRLDLMVQLARVGDWDGKVAIAKVGQSEPVERDDPESPTGKSYTVFNRFMGWYSVKDKAHGVQWVRDNCYPDHNSALTEMGLVEAVA